MNNSKNTIKCAVCGKEFEYNSTGRKRKYCSEKCKTKRDNKAAAPHNKNRYHTDDEFRARCNRQNSESHKRRLIARKEAALQNIAETVLACNTVEEIEEILKNNMRLKRETYER